MNIKTEFKKLGQLDIDPWLEALTKISPEEWAHDTWRQDVHRMHGATQTLELIYDKDFRHFNPTKQELYTRLDAGSLLKPAIELCEKEYGRGYPVRAILVKLLGGKSVARHTDIGASYMQSHRMHMPLISEGRVDYIVGNKVQHFNPGELWEINNAIPHEVNNFSDKDRINLIFDFGELNGKGWWWR